MILQELFDCHSIQTENGLDAVPRAPGIYAVVNRLTRRAYVGNARNLWVRCYGHLNGFKRGQTGNGLIRRDLELHGPEHFACVTLEAFSSLHEAGGAQGLAVSENEWIVRLGTHRETVGYNAMLYREWTKGASFRDRERKLLRRRRNYVLLDGVDLYDPIADVLLDSWTRDPRVTER